LIATQNQTDQLLATRAQRGDREAFERLIRLHWDGLVGFLYRMCGDPALAEDAAQTACLKAWQHLSGYRPEAPFRVWLYRIGMNAAVDALRRERPEPALDDLPAEQIAGSEPSPEAAYTVRERRERVQAAVLSLPPAARAVLVLREYQGLAYQEIADALDIPLGTVMSRLSYARGKLAEMLKSEVEDG
jgi:RNA polymerase sigma-70 factor (ECF subfamily)